MRRTALFEEENLDVMVFFLILIGRTRDDAFWPVESAERLTRVCERESSEEFGKSIFSPNLSALIRINTHVVSSFSKRRRGQKTTTIEISLAVVFVFFSREEEEEEEQTREKIRR